MRKSVLEQITAYNYLIDLGYDNIISIVINEVSKWNKNKVLVDFSYKNSIYIPEFTYDKTLKLTIEIDQGEFIDLIKETERDLNLEYLLEYIDQYKIEDSEFNELMYKKHYLNNLSKSESNYFSEFFKYVSNLKNGDTIYYKGEEYFVLNDGKYKPKKSRTTFIYKDDPTNYKEVPNITLRLKSKL